jgi:hypothetical protein
VSAQGLRDPAADPAAPLLARGLLASDGEILAELDGRGAYRPAGAAQTQA